MIEETSKDWFVDSAGTGSWHVGEPPHWGSQKVAIKNGIDISNQRARQITHTDFERFDLILAMDSENYSDLIAMAKSEEEKKKVKLILNYSFPGTNMAVPDPYFTGGFDEVYSLLNKACQQLLNNLKV